MSLLKRLGTKAKTTMQIWVLFPLYKNGCNLPDAITPKGTKWVKQDDVVGIVRELLQQERDQYQYGSFQYIALNKLLGGLEQK